MKLKPDQIPPSAGEEPEDEVIDSASLNIDVLNKNLTFDKGLKEKAAINDDPEAYKEYLF